MKNSDFDLNKKNDDKKKKPNWHSLVEELFLPTFLLFVTIGVFGSFIYSFFSELGDMKDKSSQITTQTFNIVSLDFNTSLNGNFVLGTGKLEDEQYYVCYKVLEDGGKKLTEIPCDITTIYDTLKSDENAYLEEDRNYYDGLRAVRLYVPENTIQQSYDLSLSHD